MGRLRLFQLTAPYEALTIRPNLPPADTLATPTVVEVMFLYTAEAIVGAGSEQRLKDRIDQAIAEANYTYTNSQINISIRSVHQGLIGYEESGDIQQDLVELAFADGAFAEVPSLRNDFKADIVCLITEQENQGIAGLAWDIPGKNGNSSTAFLALRRQALGADITLAHELGHLFGCAHDREHAGDLDQAFYRNARSYIFGYRFQVEGVTYIDVMAYEPGVVLPNFGNPRMNLDGVPMGVAEGLALPSDTARAINETAPYVAAYRQANSRIEFIAAETNVLRSDGMARIALKRTGDLSASTRVTITVGPESTAVSGTDYNPPSVMEVSFAAGQSDALFNVRLVTGPPEARELQLLLRGPAGAHGLGAVSSTIVQIQNKPPIVRQESYTVTEAAGALEIVPLFAPASATNLPTVRFHLEAGSAVAGLDYEDASGPLTTSVANGAVQIQPVRIRMLNDTVAEEDKTFRIIYETSADGLYAPMTNEIRLVDDDRRGAVLSAPGNNLDPDGGFSVAVRHDHKFLVWGGFSRLAGMDRTAIALLNSDGTVSPGFNPPQFLAGHRRIEHLQNAVLSNARVQTDGKILVTGQFARADGKARSQLARLQANGALDESFGSDLQFDGAVDTLEVQPDGKVLIGGAFEKINGQRRSFIARLNQDGSVDESFAPGGGPTSSWTVFVVSLCLQPDGKIVMGGLFDQVDGIDSPNIARLNPDGTIDRSFKIAGASGPVLDVQRQSDGRILLAGIFDEVNGVTSRKLARLDSDGTLDPTFQAPMLNAEVRHVKPLPDGRLVIDGAFTKVGDEKRRFIAVLLPDGSLDRGFDPGTGPDERPGRVSLHADGSLYLSGSLTTMNSLPAAGLVQLKFGSVPSALTKVHLTPRGEVVLEASVLPGGEYEVDGSEDLRDWRELGSFLVEGFSPEWTTMVPQSGAKQFLKLRQLNPQGAASIR